MANKRILLGILVLALVFGMTVVGCDSGSTDGGSSGSGGTFTLTDIPAAYNGKYACLLSGGVDDDELSIVGAKSVKQNGFTPVLIANGSVSLPMWTFKHSSDDGTIINIKRYIGNDIVDGDFYIDDTITYDTLVRRRFFSIVFSKGSATQLWDMGNEW